jgi:Na+/proline symporter
MSWMILCLVLSVSIGLMGIGYNSVAALQGVAGPGGNKERIFLAMVGYAWGGFGAAFGPVMILSLTWRGTTKYGALGGMIVGAATIFVVKNYVRIEGEYFYELLPGFILAFLTVILVSLATPPPGEATLRKFDESQ